MTTVLVVSVSGGFCSRRSNNAVGGVVNGGVLGVSSGGWPEGDCWAWVATAKSEMNAQTVSAEMRFRLVSGG